MNLRLVTGEWLLDLLEQAVDRGAALPCATHFRNDLLRDVPERRRLRRIRIGHHDGMAAVAAIANRGIDRDTPKKRHAKFLRCPLSSPVGENFCSFAAMAAHEEAHVLN